MRRKTLIAVLIIIIAGAGLAGGLYWRWLNSPRYALQQMVLALKTKNLDSFFKYADIKEIFNNFVNDSTPEAAAPEGQEKDEWGGLSRMFGSQFARQLMPKLFDSFEKPIKKAVGHYLSNLDNTQILGLAAAATLADIQVQDDKAQVTVKDPKTQKLLRFQMRQNQNRVWRVVQVNHQDLKSFFKKEAKKRD